MRENTRVYSKVLRTKWSYFFLCSLVFQVTFSTIRCLLSFLTLVLADGFYLSFSDSKSPHVNRTLLSILTVLNNAVVWMVFTRPPTSRFSSPFNNSLVIAPNATNSIYIIVTFMFHSSFSTT